MGDVLAVEAAATPEQPAINRGVCRQVVRAPYQHRFTVLLADHERRRVNIIVLLGCLELRGTFQTRRPLLLSKAASHDSPWCRRAMITAFSVNTGEVPRSQYITSGPKAATMLVCPGVRYGRRKSVPHSLPRHRLADVGFTSLRHSAGKEWRRDGRAGRGGLPHEINLPGGGSRRGESFCRHPLQLCWHPLQRTCPVRLKPAPVICRL
jgi:hypothetical protein